VCEDLYITHYLTPLRGALLAQRHYLQRDATAFSEASKQRLLHMDSSVRILDKAVDCVVNVVDDSL